MKYFDAHTHPTFVAYDADRENMDMRYPYISIYTADKIMTAIKENKKPESLFARKD